MENRINNIMTLKNGKKYAVVNQAIYRNVNYYFVVGVTDDEEDLTEEFRIIEEVNKDGKKFVKDVKDKKLIELLAKYLKPKEA